MAVINFIENNNLLAKVAEDSQWIQINLLELKENFPLIGDIRGIGLLWGVELVKDHFIREKANSEAEKIMYHCMKEGLSFKVSQGNVLQLSPALTITREELQRAMTILSGAFQNLRAN